MDRDALRNMLARHEGLRLKPYPCSRNHMTIGYGWNLKNPLPRSIDAYLNINGEITKEMAEKLLDISMDTAIRQAWDIFPQFGGFSERRQMALVDWLFNVGIGTALTFRRTLAAIYAGEWGKAADAMADSRWFGQTGDRSREICDMVRNG